MEEVKIKKVDVKNCKAVSEFTAIFDGKCAHVTGANGFGKSTVIRVLVDRLRGLKPSIVTKIGEKEGKYTMHLTDGCRFEWEFNNQGKDMLNYFTPNDIKPVRRDVFKHICGQYFPSQFDINKFLTTSAPRERLSMISELVQVDLTEVQGRYKGAFDIRRDAKRDLKVLEAQIKPKPEVQTFCGLNCDVEQKKVDDVIFEIEKKKDAIEIERGCLNDEYVENKKVNGKKEKEHTEAYKTKLDEWLEYEEKKESEINEFNKSQESKTIDIEDNRKLISSIYDLCSNTFANGLIDYIAMGKFVDEMPKSQGVKVYASTPKPELTTLDLPDPMPSSKELDEIKLTLETKEGDLVNAKETLETKKAELSDLNTAKKVYDLQIKQYDEFQAGIKKQSDYVQECEVDVSTILEEIKKIISETKLPSDFSIDLENKNDILFRTSPDAEYLPITNETLASSAIFIAAFKLQANYLEAFRVTHFDVSYLDDLNREAVIKEAINMDIQLITESPSYNEETRMLQYKITED